MRASFFYEGPPSRLNPSEDRGRSDAENPRSEKDFLAPSFAGHCQKHASMINENSSFPLEREREKEAIMIGIVDYKAGNLTSVARALQYLSVPCRVTDDPEILGKCERIIFPGVGAAGEAMANLRQTGMDRFIRERIERGVPVLGICLGTQVILDRSEENEATCLGIVPGSVKRFPDDIADRDGRFLKIPHMGWNRVAFRREHPVFKGISDEAEFYFVHSYFPSPLDDGHALGWTDYGLRFCSAMARKNLVAVQFHPEKSGRPGLQILANFSRWEGDDAQ